MLNDSLEKNLSSLRRSPASEPNLHWVASVRSKLEWTMARGETIPPLSPLLGKEGMGRSPFAWCRRPFAAAIASLALLLLIGGGVTYAAQGALPGTPLYPVKLASEELRVKLAANNTARTELELELANRRVEEFRVLSSQNKITPETAAKITTRYEAHVSAALTALPTLPQDIVSNITAAVSQAIDAHIEVTAKFEQENEDGDEGESEAQTREEIREQMKQKREEIKKQIERLRAFARESREAAKLLQESSKYQDVKWEVKVETDEDGRAHVKIEAERKKNGNGQKKKIEFTAPRNTATSTINIFKFEDDEDEKEKGKREDDIRATTTFFFNTSTSTPTISPLLRGRVRGGTQLNIKMKSSGSGSIEQNIKTEIKSESKVKIRSGSTNDEDE